MTATGLDRLRRIADDRRARISEMQAREPAHRLRARLGPVRPGGRLERALRRGPASAPIRLLCEIKRTSPAHGVLRSDLDPVAIARTYHAHGAAAISIVTEPDHFHGDLAWVDQVRAAVPLPILLKDFVVDGYQILDAAVRGADGILLIASLQSDVQLQILITQGRLLGLDCLVEVHDETELRRAVRAGATVIGVNNRDLRTFEIDLGRSLMLLPLVPPLVTAVAESGLSTPEDLARLRAMRCDAALLGEVFMTSPDLPATLARLVAAAAG